MSTITEALTDTIKARLAQQRNPNVSTDQGVNSVSPYYLTAGPAGGFSSLVTGVPDTGATSASRTAAAATTASSSLSAADATTRAAASAALAKAQAAQAANRAKAAQLAQSNQTALQNAAAKKKAQALAAKNNTVAWKQTNNKTERSNGLGVDKQSQAAYQHAVLNGYAGRVTTQNYSKYYQYDPTLSNARNKALAVASSYIGTHYALGGESHSAIDCSGLVQAVYQQLGFKVPTHSAADQGQTGGRHNANGIPGTRTAVSNLKPGDLVAWRDGSHIAIYAGNGEIIESANSNVGTVRRKLWASPSQVVGIHLHI